MCVSKDADRRVFRAARICLLPAPLLACVAAYSQAFAACLPSADPAIRQPQTLVNRDAKQALSKVQGLLDVETASGHPSSARMAALYDVQAQAYSILELDGDAREAVTKGLSFVTGDSDPIRLDLLATLAENVYDQAGIDAAD